MSTGHSRVILGQTPRPAAEMQPAALEFFFMTQLSVPDTKNSSFHRQTGRQRACPQNPGKPRLSDADKSRCLEFLLTNHPMDLLHPYTKEWKVKLEELELGCDAPDESDDEVGDDYGIEVADLVEENEIDDVLDGGDDDYEDEDEIDT